MKSVKEYNKHITEENTFELIYKNEYEILSNYNCFDKYGNYTYPTDFVSDTPNTATGTSSGPSFLDGIVIL